ncbi:unnamed protein product [Lathyrus sativus]|nr:unnamed protein product [Lathyrus sativus]
MGNSRRLWCCMIVPLLCRREMLFAGVIVRPALMELGRLSEAVMDCEEAVKLDPAYARAHKRLASLYLRFGQVENSRRHLHIVGVHDDRSGRE